MKFRRTDRKLHDVFSYFEYHRHWGQDIYLVTQNTRKLPSDIVQLVESVIVASPRIRSFTGEFKYKWMDGRDILKREVLRPSSAIFELYSSMDEEETEKIKNPLIKTVLLIFGASVIVVASGYYFFTSRWTTTESKSDIVETESQSIDNKVSVSSSARVVPQADFYHYLPLNLVVEHVGRKSNFIVFWNGNMIRKSDFPYKIVRIGTRFYAQLSDTIFNSIYDEDSLPSDQIIIDSRSS